MASREGPSAPFLCEPLKEREKKPHNNTWGFNRARGFYSQCKRRFWFDFSEFHRSGGRSKATFPTAVDAFTKKAFTANKCDTVRCRKSKERTQRGTGSPPPCFNKRKEGSFLHVHFIFQGFSQGEQSINWEGKTLMEKWKGAFFWVGGGVGLWSFPAFVSSQG